MLRFKCLGNMLIYYKVYTFNFYKFWLFICFPERKFNTRLCKPLPFCILGPKQITITKKQRKTMEKAPNYPHTHLGNIHRIWSCFLKNTCIGIVFPCSWICTLYRIYPLIQNINHQFQIIFRFSFHLKKIVILLISPHEASSKILWAAWMTF